MADDDKPLGSLLRRHLRTHKSIGMLSVLAEQVLGETLERIGSGIERKLGMTQQTGGKPLDTARRNATIPLIGAAIGAKLLDRMIVPELAQVSEPKETLKKLHEINDVLSSLTEAELEKISRKSIDEAIEKTKPTPKVARKPPRPRPQTGGSPGSSGRSWGGK